MIQDHKQHVTPRRQSYRLRAIVWTGAAVMITAAFIIQGPLAIAGIVVGAAAMGMTL
jgi:hypothetical protein